MSTPDQMLYTLLDGVARMEVQIQQLKDTQDKQEKILEELVAKANQGKGVLWVLVGLGTILGMAISYMKDIIQIVSQK